jgi:hypothetical protein
VVDDDALRHEGRGVAVIGLEIGRIGADAIAEEAVVPAHRLVDPLGIGVDQELGGIEPMSGLRRIRPVHAIAVPLARTQVGQVTVPDEVRLLGEADSLLVAAIGIEQAELDGGRVLAEEGEVHAGAIPGGTERERGAAPDPHRRRGAAATSFTGAG